MIRRAAAEAIGTFFLVLIGTGAVMTDALTAGALGVVGIAAAFGLVVAAMIHVVGPISGAHINPAVSVGFYAAGSLSGRDLRAYVVAQCAGAVAASVALRLMLGDVAGLGASVPTVSVGSAFLLEWLMTFALMFVIAAVALGKSIPAGLGGLAIGGVVAMDALFGGPLTGASMNPARSLGPALAGGVWTHHWLYWLAPVSAAAVASNVWDLLQRPDASAAEAP